MDATFINLFNLYKSTRTNVFFILLLFMMVFLTACSTQPVINKTKNISDTTTKEITLVMTAEQKLALAQSINAQTPADVQSQLSQQAEITALLIEACELFLQQQNFTQALSLANYTTELTHDDFQKTYRLLLVKAASLQSLKYHQQAYQQLQLAQALVTYTQNNFPASAFELNLDYYLVLNQVLTAQEKPVLALTALLHAFALNSNSSTEDVLAIWLKLQSLSPWQITQLVSTNPPFIKGWQQLLSYSHKFGANNEQFTHYLHLWQQNNPTHPASSIIAQLQTQNSIVFTVEKAIENIAVLLPLSGSQQQAGLAAQQGILAAYNNNITTNIHFVDTNQVDWKDLSNHFNKLNIDHIIGPLLRADVETFLATSKEHIALQVPTLLLNLSSQYQLENHQVAMSMRPEDEAEQAAATLSLRNYKKPIILSHQDSVSSRIALAFSQQWQKSTGHPVDIVYFNQGKQMQTSLKGSLDITTSQTRIDQLNGRLKDNIKSEPRNRRDIDMIYLIGSAAQTRLIKPYIDVNTSPFSDIIPVYASSRSHSNFNDKHNSSSATDLQGLTFTQIPWLLKSQQQNEALVTLSDKIWPKRTDSLSRIFAMGFDSYNLLSTAFHMKQLPYIHHFGQTGTLTLSDDSILTRSLIWGRYQDDKVMQVVLD